MFLDKTIDTLMRSQKEVWQEEHVQPGMFTRMHSDKPSSPVLEFASFLKKQGYKPELTLILDIGCGKGRNSIWLASQGFNVVGIDFVLEAIEEAKKRNLQQYSNLKFEVVDLSQKLLYDDNSYDAIIDCNSTICIPNPGRTNAVAEAFRVLKPRGYYLFYGIGSTEFAAKSSGFEPHSVVFSRTGKFEKQYNTREELVDAYQNFQLIKLDELVSSDVIEGKETTYLMWLGIFQK